jgi:hypothetical protein
MCRREATIFSITQTVTWIQLHNKWSTNGRDNKLLMSKRAHMYNICRDENRADTDGTERSHFFLFFPKEETYLETLEIYNIENW